MNVSPSPSPRRQPLRPLGNNNGSDNSDFYQISLENDDSSPTGHSGHPAGSTPKLRPRPQSAFLGGTHASHNSYENYDSYKSCESYNNYENRDSRDGARSLRPVQQYHSAFSNVDAGSKAAAASSTATAPPASASPFATISSASRAFLDHRRQQSIPNLLPSFASSIGRSFSRAISPERSSRPSRPPIPEFNNYNSQYKSREMGNDEKSKNFKSENTGRGKEDSEDSDESDDSDDSDDSETSEDDEDSRRSNIAPFTGDRRTRRSNTYTARTNSTRDNSASNPESPSLKANFANWLASSNTTRVARVGSPDRRFIDPSPVTTPERTTFTARGGDKATGPGANAASRRLSYVSDGLATPRSAGMAHASATSTSRFSQITSSMTATLSRLTQQQSPVSRRTHLHSGTGLEDDELYHLNVEAALFPSGQPADHDAFSPSAYKNLEVNAVQTIRQLQAAYRERTMALWDLAADKSARDEEFEETETRVQHLKMQLEGMAHKAAQQQKDMDALRDELAAEKMARAYEREMLSSAAVGYEDVRHDDQITTTAFSEDLSVEEAQRSAAQKNRHGSRQWRKSLTSVEGSSIDDSDGYEDEEEDESASSVFSRSRSPIFAPGTFLDAQPAYHPRVAALGSVSAKQGSRPTSPSTALPQQQQTLGKFQKLVKNVTAALKDEDGQSGYGPKDCRNCRGQDASFAWNTVSVLRDENKQLKQRVGQLEVAVEGALDMVNGVGLY